MTTLTIIVPAYNETSTILEILKKISKVNIDKQIIVIDDCSSDDSREKILSMKYMIDKIILHDKNLGKGAAIKSAQKFIKGQYVIIQDADLEYDPNDYEKLIEPLKKKQTKVVYGSRVLEKKRYSAKNFSSLSRVFFNHCLTILSNIINNQNLTDAHTCYKVFDSELFKSIKLEENGFAFCPEITTKTSLLNCKIIEISINYIGRTYKDGKKIKFVDGIQAIVALLKYRYLK
jgi:glycosyltransferase involved in cell wall biosynthesis